MPFDPSQPFDVIEEGAPSSGFDPSKPFDVVEEPSWIDRQVGDAKRWGGERVTELKRGVEQAKQMLDVADLLASKSVENTADKRAADPAGSVHPLDRAMARIFPSLSNALQATPEAVAAAAKEDQARATHYSQQAANQLALDQSQMEVLPASRAMQDFQDAPNTVMGMAGALAKHPIALPADLALNSLPAAAPGMAVGALIGSETGPWGTAAGTALGSLAPEVSAKLTEAMQEAGADLRSPQSISAFMADEEKVSKAMNLALRKGVPIAIIDGLTARFAGRFLHGASGKGLRKVAAATLKETALQMAGGATGETAGELVAGEDLSPKDILSEAVAELPTAVQEVHTNIKHERGLHKSGATPAAPIDVHTKLSADQPAGTGETGAVQMGRTAPTSAPVAPADPVAAIMQELSAAAEQKKAEAAAAETERAQRQAELQARQQALAGHLERAEQTVAAKDPTWSAVQGAINTLAEYQDDNSLRLPQPQRDRLAATTEALAARRESLRATEEARRANEATQAAAEAQRQADATKAAVKTEKETLAQIDRTGRDTDGRIVDLSRLPQEQLERIAELQDHEAEGLTAGQVETEMRRRMQAEETAAVGKTEAGADLLSALRQVKLPTQDKALGAELHQLITEGMTVRDRKRLVKNGRTGGLDSVAEQLRVDHGFGQILTPADVIDHVQRALRGEQVLPQRGVEFAAAARAQPLTTGITEKILNQPIQPVTAAAAPAWTGANPQNAQNLRAYLEPLIGQRIAGVDITNAGIKHFARLQNGPTEFRMAAQLKELLANSVPLALAEPTNQKGVTMERRVAAAEIDGKIMPVRITIRHQGNQATIYHLENAERHSRVGLRSAEERGSDRSRSGAPLTVRDLLSGVKQQADGNYSAEFARGQKNAVRTLSPERRDAIWRRLQLLAPELTRQVDIELALTRKEYQRVMRENLGTDPVRGTEAAAIPAEVRRNLQAAEAKRDAIVFAAEAWSTDRKGVKRTLHESAHIFFWSLPEETVATLRQEHAIQVQAAQALRDHFAGTAPLSPETLAQTQATVGPLWTERGESHSDLEGVEDASDHGLREWFAELAMWRNRQWALRRYVRAGTMTGRLRMVIDDVAGQLREIWRGVARAFSKERDHDFSSDFWETSFRDFLAGGSTWREHQRTAALGYAKQAEFATPDNTPKPLPEGTVRSLTPEQAAAAGMGPKADPLAAIKARLKHLEAMRERMANEGGSIAAYNHQSEEIRDLQEQRRKLERERAPVAESPAVAPAPTEEAAPAAEPPVDDSEPSPFNAAEPSPAEQQQNAAAATALRQSRVQALEGQSSITPAWHTSTWDKALEIMRGFKGSIPELPTFPRAFWNKADPFVRKLPEFYNDLRQGFRIAQRSDGQVRRDAEDRMAAIVRPLLQASRPEGKRFDAALYQRLLKLQATRTAAEGRGKKVSPAMQQEITALQSRMDNDPYVLFSRLVLYLDLNWRGQNLKTPEGRPIALPMGLTPSDVEARLADIRQRITATGHADTVATALKAHTDLVAQIAEDLSARELLPQETLRNPYYFPHLVLTKTGHDTAGRVRQEARELHLEKVQADTGEAFRSYLLDPVGSDRPIETDYTKAMFYHLVQVGAHNAMADVRDHWFKPYDVRDQVAKRARELSRERGVSVGWRQAFEEEFKDRGYVVMDADAGRNLIPAVTIDREKLAQRIGAAIGEGDIRTELEKLGLKGIRILPEDVQDSLLAGAKEQWVVPARVADALRGMKTRSEGHDNAIEKTMGMAVGFWKRWMLFAPPNWLRYEFNNRVADLEKLFSADPTAFRYLPRAFKEIHAFYQGVDQTTVTPEVRAAFRHGVVGGITAEEIGKLPALNQLKDLGTDAQRWWAWIKNHNNTAFSRMDESAFRYAKFLADLERIRAGARPVYAGAYWRDIEHIREGRRPEADALEREIANQHDLIDERRQTLPQLQGAARTEAIAANARAGTRIAELERKLAATPDSRPELAAAEISNKTFGDYGDVSVNGQWLRKKLTPFWSWTEVNFKYHANLFRNLRDAVLAHDQSAAAAAKAGGRAASVFAFTMTRKGAGLFLTRLALPYLAVSMWNNSDDDDRRKIEDELSEEDRRRFHIIVGRNDDGTPDVMYFPTAFSDVAKWFGGPDFARLATEYLKGQTTLDTAVGEWTQGLLPDLLNNLVGQIGPAAKVPYVLASHRNPFPDVTDQRTIPAYDFRRAIISQMTDQFTASLIERAINDDFVDPRSAATWAKQLILQVRRRDPESWAYYSIKDKAEAFVQKETGKNRDPGAYDAPEAQVLRQFRRALYQGDVETAGRMYDRLLSYGYTADRFKASIRSQHPLANVPTTMRHEFVAGLSPFERQMLDRAMKYYTRMSTMKEDARQLFPKAGKTPAQSATYLRLFHPRPDKLTDAINDREQMDEDELDRRARQQLDAALK